MHDMLDPHDTLALLPSLLIAILSWASTIFVLQRFNGCNRLQLFALYISVLGGLAAWIAELSIKFDDQIGLQFTSSLFRATVSWYVTVLIINDGPVITRQQWIALVFRYCITLLWEVKHRIVLTPTNTTQS